MLEGTGLLLGVDGGGSRTRARLYEDGRERAAVEGPGSNPGVVGVAAAAETLVDCCERVLRDGGGARPRKVGVGLAGLSGHEAALRAALEGRLDVEVDLCTDLAAAWAGAFVGQPGLLLLAGTGAAVLAFDGARLRRAGGWGRRLQDPGSAYALVQALAQKLLAADEAGREAIAPGFGDRLCTALGLVQVRDLVGLFRREPRLAELEAALGMLGAACDEGFPEALALTHAAADDLAAMAGRAAKGLPRPLPCVLHGGLLRASAVLRRRLGDGLAALALSPAEARAGAEQGALLLALIAGGEAEVLGQAGPPLACFARALARS